MHDTLKEAVNTYIKYGRRIPLVLAYDYEIEYLDDLKRSCAGTNVVHSPLQSLHREISECNQCTAIQKNELRCADASSGIMIILNPPALLSAVEKNEMDADVQTLIEKMLSAIEVDVHNCWVTNMIKCTSKQELPGALFLKCQKLLVKEIELVKPRIVIVMGELRPLQKIIKAHSAIQWFDIEHPVTLIKNPELKKSAWNTLKLVKKSLEGKQQHVC